VKPDTWTRLKNINLWKIREMLPPRMRNRYMLTILIFLVWLLLIDSNNLIERVHQIHTRNSLAREKEYYMKRIEEDKQKLKELRTSSENLEKFAREQYHMKKPNEDLFIIVSPDEERKIRRENKISKPLNRDKKKEEKKKWWWL
jgi:cell division protein DivIC